MSVRSAAIEMRSEVTYQDAETGGQKESPYTTKNLDGAITHLEYVVAADGNVAVFGRRYLLNRI